ncbi:MAG: hypothetical protein U0893_24440 [Chloroflexota bacterium]
MTRLADIERLLSEVTSSFEDQAETQQPGGMAPDGRHLIDDLDHAQMLKAAAYNRPVRDPAG